MKIDQNKERGRAGVSLAIAYFGSNGYTVCLPLNDTQWFDFIVEKDNMLQTVQCKFTSSQDNAIVLTSSGGTNGGKYDSILNHPVDILFCADKERNMYVIPVQDIRCAGNVKSISLRTHPNQNGQGFDTYKYRVEI